MLPQKWVFSLKPILCVYSKRQAPTGSSGWAMQQIGGQLSTAGLASYKRQKPETSSVRTDMTSYSKVKKKPHTFPLDHFEKVPFITDSRHTNYHFQFFTHTLVIFKFSNTALPRVEAKFWPGTVFLWLGFSSQPVQNQKGAPNSLVSSAVACGAHILLLPCFNLGSPEKEWMSSQSNTRSWGRVGNSSLPPEKRERWNLLINKYLWYIHCVRRCGPGAPSDREMSKIYSCPPWGCSLGQKLARNRVNWLRELWKQSHVLL